MEAHVPSQPPAPPETGDVFQRLLRLSLPIVGLNVLSVLSMVVDTAMCGRLPNNENALNALGFATQVVFLAMVLMMGLVVGTVALVSRAHGAGDEARVNHILRQSMQLTVIVSLTIAVLGNVFAPAILRLLGANGAALALALYFLRPNLSLTVFIYLAMLLAAVLRGVGNTRLPFLVAIFSNALNVLFNYGLILGNFGLPSLGVQGAAIGTILSQACGVTLLIVLLRRGAVPGVCPPLRPAPFDVPLAKDLARVGAPAALDMVILNAGFASIVGMLGRIDPLAVAAHGVGLRVQGLAFVPGLGISQATGAMVGNALGAHDVRGARSVARSSMVLCTIVMSLIAVVLFVYAVEIVALFEVLPGSPLSDLTVQWMHLLGFGMPIVGAHIAVMGTLRGSGATRTSLMINIVGTAIQIPLSWFLGFGLGLGPWGIWAGFPLSFVVKALMGAAAYVRGRWAVVGDSI
ncbi:MAG: MATE family efflux transporter [Myxococcota bacterium]